MKITFVISQWNAACAAVGRILDLREIVVLQGPSSGLAHLPAPYPANEMVGYRVTDRVKSRREPDRPDFVEPVLEQA